MLDQPPPPQGESWISAPAILGICLQEMLKYRDVIPSLG